MIFSKPVEKKSVKARSKPSEYEAMLRNGFILPKLNSTIVNKIYMYRVKSNLEYCPHTSDIKVYKICINPPSKEFMLNEIHQELLKKGDIRDLTYDPKHLPDVEWCVKALLALNPDHRIFDKDYVPGVNEKGRKGQKLFANFEEEDEQQSFQEFEKGLPTHLHFQNQYQTKNFRGNQSSTFEMHDNDDTITEKGNENEMGNCHISDENKMEVQEPVNPFLKMNQQKMSAQKPDLKFSREGMVEILGQSKCLSKSYLPGQQYLPSKKMDLQSTINQLNNNLFSPNVSKNKAKKKLSNLEEEMIVNMFEKLVVNCKGRPVDFVKSYLEQYHSEKSLNSGLNSTRSSNTVSFDNMNNSAFAFAQKSKTLALEHISPNNSKTFNFGQTQSSNFQVNEFKAEPNVYADDPKLNDSKKQGQRDEKMIYSNQNSCEFVDAQNIECHQQTHGGKNQFGKDSEQYSYEQQVAMQNDSLQNQSFQAKEKLIFNI